MLPILILLCSQINPYGDAQVAPIIIPSAGAKFVTGGLGSAAIAGAYPSAVPANIGADNGAVVVEGVPGGMNQVNLDYIRTPTPGIEEDYRLAQILIARTAQRRMEALRLQLAARNIEVTNAQIREYLCTRFCSPTATTLPATPMYPTDLRAVDPNFGVPAPIDPALYPTPLPYTPVPRDDFNARYYIRHGGTVQVQVLPGYRRRY